MKDEDFKIKPIEFKKRDLRFAARAIVKKDDKIAIIHISKDNYYKIPGGGIKDGESIKEGLIREVWEETGCRIIIEEEVGEIVEYKTHWDMIQTSYCFTSTVTKIGKPHFTKKELESGSELIWTTIPKAIKLFKSSNMETYAAKFMATRDLTFLKEAEKIL